MNILKRITTGLSIAILAICAGMFVLFSVSGTGWKALSIPTASMRPTISPGSLVLVHRVPVSSLRVGDVITYTNPRDIKTTITHRIIKTYMIDGRIPGFVTKGDANPTADMSIAAGSVVGKVEMHAPHLGSLLMGGKTWVSIGLLVYLPALLLMIEEIQRLSEYLREVQPYKLRERAFQKQQKQAGVGRKYAMGLGLTALSILIAIGVAAPALAAIKTAPVTLANNRISAAAATTGGGTCSGNNNTSVDISNSSSQTASSGNVSSTGNTTTGSVTSGNATNNNSTSININVNNCH